MAVDPFALVQASVAQNNQWSAAQAQKQMDFQERMANTAHQREIVDLQAAGLNPVLSARLGGAETPSGAMGTTDTSGTSALIEALKEFGEGMMSSAVAAAAGRSGSGFYDPSSGSQVLATLGSYGDKDKFKSFIPYIMKAGTTGDRDSEISYKGVGDIITGSITGNAKQVARGVGTVIQNNPSQVKKVFSKQGVKDLVLNALIPGRSLYQKIKG